MCVTLLPYVCNSQPVHYTSGVRTGFIGVMGKGELTVLNRIIHKKKACTYIAQYRKKG